MNAQNNTTLETRHQTQTKINVLYENGFLVLPDAKTVVGADKTNNKKLIIEDITLGNPAEVGVHLGCVRNVLYDAKTQSLFAGDAKGNLRQYERKYGWFILKKDFGNLGVTQIQASAQVEGFLIFGGVGGSIAVVDASKQQVRSRRINSPFFYTDSLQVCPLGGSKVYLFLGGSIPGHSKEASDWVDVTRVFNKYNICTGPVLEDSGPTQGLLQEKEQAIDSSNRKVRQLEASLQEQREKHRGKSNLQKSKGKTTPFGSKSSH